jgi:hypothetical protein
MNHFKCHDCNVNMIDVSFFLVFNNRKKSSYENINQIETDFISGSCDISLIVAVILLSAAQDIIYKCFMRYCGWHAQRKVTKTSLATLSHLMMKFWLHFWDHLLQINITRERVPQSTSNCSPSRHRHILKENS